MIAGARFPVIQPFAGGLEAHTWLLATELERTGVDVDVFAPAGSDPRLTTRPMPRAPAISGAARDDLSGAPARIVADHHAFLGVMLALGGPAQYDVVHNNSVHHLPVAMASAVAMPVVTTLHTPPTPWIESAIQLRGPATAGSFVAVSRHTATSWEHLVPDAVIIPNGVDTEVWHAGVGGGGVVWSGRMVPEKAPHLAIDAARRAGMPIRLAGPAHDRGYWDREIAPRLDHDAVWVGHLGQGELAGLVGSGSVCAVTPSWDEPFGLVVLESLACGTPVAAFARGGVPEVLDQHTGRLCAPDDVGALALALVDATALSRAACRERAVQTGSCGTMARRYLDVYQSLLP